MGLQEDLDAISALQGKVVPPGNVIAGFGPGTAAPPPLTTARERYGEPIELEPIGPQTPEPDGFDDPEAMIVPAPSPLIPPPEPGPTRYRSPEDRPRPQLALEQTELLVMGQQAGYKDQQVILLDSELTSVKKIVLRAIQRVVRERLAEIAPKREVVKRRKRKT